MNINCLLCYVEEIAIAYMNINFVFCFKENQYVTKFFDQAAIDVVFP